MNVKKIKFISIIVSCLFFFMSENLSATSYYIPPEVAISAELQTAAEQGNIESIKAHIEGKEFAAGTIDKILKIAAQKGHFEVIKYLTTNNETKGKINSGLPFTTGANAAFDAALKSKRLDIVDYLATNEATKEKIGAGVNFGLAAASRNNDLNTIRYLAENENTKHKISFGIMGRGVYEAFTRAARNGNLEIIKYLATNVVTQKKINHYAAKGALSYAESGGYDEIVTYLKSHEIIKPLLAYQEPKRELKEVKLKKLPEIKFELKPTLCTKGEKFSNKKNWKKKLENLMKTSWVQEPWVKKRIQKYEKKTGKVFTSLSAKKQFKKLKRWNRKHQKRLKEFDFIKKTWGQDPWVKKRIQKYQTKTGKIFKDLPLRKKIKKLRKWRKKRQWRLKRKR